MPTASVQPHLSVSGNYAAHWDRDWRAGASLAVGLLGRVEAGATAQAYPGGKRGPRLGSFARVMVSPAGIKPFRLAVGYRHLQSLSWGRYVVGSASLDGLRAGPIRYGATLGAGWGTQGFLRVAEEAWGRRPDHESGASGSSGVFVGSVLHIGLGSGMRMDVGWELAGGTSRAGAHLDLGGVRVGAVVAGDAGSGGSVRKGAGVLLTGSFRLCGVRRGRLCGALRRPAPDTVTLPAPPPDTVIVERGGGQATRGESTTLCLGAGSELEIVVTEGADTLVSLGGRAVPIPQLRAGLVIAGSYAEGRDWQREGAPVVFRGRRYRPTRATRDVACGRLRLISRHEGVGIFAPIASPEPYREIYLPLGPGTWQVYELDPGQ